MDFAIMMNAQRLHISIFSDNLNSYLGQQYTVSGKDIFGCFSDVLSDRWGRTLINRKEQILTNGK